MLAFNSMKYFLVPITILLSLLTTTAISQNDSLQETPGLEYLFQSETYFDSNIDSALFYIEKAAHIAIENADNSLLASCHNYRGILFEDKSRYAEALIEYTEARNIALSLKDSSGIASYANNMAGIYVGWGEYSKALTAYFEALDIYIQIDDTDGVATIYNNVGILYDYQKDYSKALEYYNKALVIYRELDSKEGIANSLNNIGLIHFYNKDFDKARDHFIKSLSYDFERNDKYGIAISFGNIGDLYHEMGDDSTALQYFIKAQDLNKQIGNKEGIARVNLQQANLYRNNNQFKIAEKLLFESLDIANEISVVEVNLDLLDELHKLYFQKNDLKKAYLYQAKYYAYKDSIFSNEKQERLNELQSRYDYQKHLQDIELLQDKSQLATMQLKQQQLKNQQQRGILYAVIFIVFIVAYFFIHSARNNKKIYRKNVELEAKNKEIEAARKELLIAKEKAEEADMLKSSFLANMSHEIRTPMNAILGFSELLAEPSIPIEEKNEYVKYIKSSGKTLLTLINDIIDIAKIEAGQVNIKIQPTNVNVIINEFAEYYKELRYTFEKTSVDFIAETALPDDKATILTDHERFRQIMNNLLSNALKFTESGHIKLGYKKQEENLLFFVEDTGIGIKQKNLTLIFDHFRQIDESHTRKFGGTGLGLTISRNLTEMLGGKIWADSQPGKGSVFYFTVPYNPVKELDVEQESYSTAELTSLKNKIILVAEDEESNFFLMKTQLRNTGITLLRAKNGLQAIEIYKVYGKQIDLTLMDIQMPEMNGYDAMKGIRDFDPDAIIIAQTAHAMADEQQKIIDSGFNDYLSKPITKTKFNKLLAKYLK